MNDYLCQRQEDTQNRPSESVIMLTKTKNQRHNGSITVVNQNNFLSLASGGMMVNCISFKK